MIHRELFIERLVNTAGIFGPLMQLRMGVRCQRLRLPSDDGCKTKERSLCSEFETS